MKKTILIAVSFAALVLAATAGAALVPSVYDPGHTGCVTSTYSGGVLHLAKNCPTATDAAAQADITGLAGQPFTSASFTLASAAQCQGGSPRIDLYTTARSNPYFLGCSNVTPTTNSDGTVTYTITPATLAAAAQDVPTGTITSAQLLIDVQGTADVSKIMVNGTLEVPAVTSTTPTKKSDCKHGGYKTFTNPSFKNQGQCVSYVAHHSKHGKSHEEHHSTTTHHDSK